VIKESARLHLVSRKARTSVEGAPVPYGRRSKAEPRNKKEARSTGRSRRAEVASGERAANRSRRRVPGLTSVLTCRIHHQPCSLLRAPLSTTHRWGRRAFAFPEVLHETRRYRFCRSRRLATGMPCPSPRHPERAFRPAAAGREGLDLDVGLERSSRTVPIPAERDNYSLEFVSTRSGRRSTPSDASSAT